MGDSLPNRILFNYNFVVWLSAIHVDLRVKISVSSVFIFILFILIIYYQAESGLTM